MDQSLSHLFLLRRQRTVFHKYEAGIQDGNGNPAEGKYLLHN